MAGSLDGLAGGLARLSGKQKFQIVLAVAAIVGLVWGVSAYATRVRYGVLFSNLRAGDAAPVLSALKEQRVPFRVTAGGSVIEVPVGQIDELRLELAGEGLLPGGGVGFEIFDKPSFGLSDFVQNVNYRRALERELGRTIGSLDSVESARVHLALPPESVFADDRREPSASVVVRLRAGSGLAAQQVRAITHMVASGVEGLSAARVSVIDGNGRMLSGGDEAERDAMSTAQAEAREAFERNLESTLVSILEPVVGQGKVRARATVELNMKRVSRVEETYDPSGAVVRSEQKTKSEQRAGGTGGVPGTASNLPGGTTAGAASSGMEKSQSATTNFELNKTVATIEEPVGTLLRQSVAVVVDNAPPAPGARGNAANQSRARTDEEMQKITDLVRAAIGYEETRGDTLIVENIAFDATALPVEPADPGTDLWHALLPIVRYVSVPLAVLLIILLVVRPGIAALRSLGAPAAGPGGAPMTVGELQAHLARGSLPQPGGGGASGLRQKLIEAARDDPKTAALIVRDWLEPKAGD